MSTYVVRYSSFIAPFFESRLRPSHLAKRTNVRDMHTHPCVSSRKTTSAANARSAQKRAGKSAAASLAFATQVTQASVIIMFNQANVNEFGRAGCHVSCRYWLGRRFIDYVSFAQRLCSPLEFRTNLDINSSVVLVTRVRTATCAKLPPSIVVFVR